MRSEERKKATAKRNDRIKCLSNKTNDNANNAMNE